VFRFECRQERFEGRWRDSEIRERHFGAADDLVGLEQPDLVARERRMWQKAFEEGCRPLRQRKRNREQQATPFKRVEQTGEQLAERGGLAPAELVGAPRRSRCLTGREGALNLS
jgi:hypothetical protein